VKIRRVFAAKPRPGRLLRGLSLANVSPRSVEPFRVMQSHLPPASRSLGDAAEDRPNRSLPRRRALGAAPHQSDNGSSFHGAPGARPGEPERRRLPLAGRCSRSTARNAATGAGFGVAFGRQARRVRRTLRRQSRNSCELDLDRRFSAVARLSAGARVRGAMGHKRRSLHQVSCLGGPLSRARGPRSGRVLSLGQSPRDRAAVGGVSAPGVTPAPASARGKRPASPQSAVPRCPLLPIGAMADFPRCFCPRVTALAPA